MAITRLEFPAASNPTINQDYVRQNALIAALAIQGMDGLKLTGWSDTTTLPALKMGTYIRHNGYLYVVDSADYAIQGTITSGAYNYIILSGTGTTITATWSTSKSGYIYDPVKCGLYLSTNQVLREFVYLSSGSYINGYIDYDGKRAKLQTDA